MQKLSRREALRGTGVTRGELGALVDQYFAELAAFNADPRMEDDDLYFADQPFDGTLRRMIGVPVRSLYDAEAAARMVLECGRNCMIDFSEYPYGQVANSLVREIRSYLQEVQS